MQFSWALTLVPFLSAGAGAYLGSYLKKKGENLATHEDIGKLVDQVRAVTTTTKEIEAKISSDVWDRQQRWELKREVLFKAAKQLADLEDAVLALHSMNLMERIDPTDKTSDASRLELKNASIKKWSDASTLLDEMKLFVEIVCEKQTAETVASLGTLLNQTASKIVSGLDKDFYTKTVQDRRKNQSALKAAIRKELGIAATE